MLCQLHQKKKKKYDEKEQKQSSEPTQVKTKEQLEAGQSLMSPSFFVSHQTNNYNISQV